MNIAYPTRLLHRGSILVSGFVITPDIVGEQEARRRILGIWSPGLLLYRNPGGLVALLPEASRMSTDDCIGVPLVRYGSLLSALPLSESEMQNLKSRGNAIVLCRGGTLEVTPIAELPIQDPTQWIHVDAFEVAIVNSLGQPPEKPQFEQPKFDPRQKMPGVPAASSELERLLSELKGNRSQAKPTATMADMAAGVRAWFQRLVVRWRTARPAGHASRSASQGVRAAAIKNGLWQSLRSKTQKLADFMRLSRLFSAAHARYLARMVEMFRAGNLEEGLRHAIPLADAERIPQQNRAFFPRLGPRYDLSIRMQNPTRSSVGVKPQVMDFLRGLYRQAFARLEAQGRIEEAAFVLTELLSAHAEAVSFLEKHRRFRLAAELAEARALPPALIIRLWWLAKEPARAIAAAVRTGEVERAIHYLCVTHPKEADQLRLAWAERLAASGKLVAAAEIIWPVRTERHLAYRWFTQAIELGGASGATALASVAARFPEDFSSVLPQVEELMADESRELAVNRTAFALQLFKEMRVPDCRFLGRMATRSIIRDLQRGFTFLTSPQFRSLVEYTMDPSLRTDVPAWAELKRQGLPGDLNFIHELLPTDVGRRQISDVALLPDGKLLVALGENGVQLLSREGKVITHWNEPAQRLVISSDGRRAIALAYRGRICRLARIDLLVRTVTYWCDTEITRYCSTFDGSLWVLANGHDVYAMDVLKDGFESVWSIPDLPGVVMAIHCDLGAKKLYLVTEGSSGILLWTYDYPSFVLRTKGIYDREAGDVELSREVAAGTRTVIGKEARIVDEGRIFEETSLLCENGTVETTISRLTVGSASHREPIRKYASRGSLTNSAAFEYLLVIPIAHRDNCEIHVLNTHSLASRLCLRLLGSKAVSLHFSGGILVCGDDLGRIIAIDTTTNERLRDFRI